MEVWLDWRSIGSLIASLIFLRSVVRDFLPPEISNFILLQFRRLVTYLDRRAKIIIEDDDGSAYGNPNELYEAAQTYLGSRCLAAAPVVLLSKRRDTPLPTASLPSSHKAVDTFNGVRLGWVSNVKQNSPMSSNFGYRSRAAERRYLELSFHRRYGDVVRQSYIPHVLKEAERIRLMSRERQLYTNRALGEEHHHKLWSPVPFAHPSTFETLAIDTKLRDEIRADLERFKARRDYYARVGRAWKRGYLLHGPPGTGKTSLVAAIANFLEFDIYDLELTAVPSNTHLRRLLVSTSPKSILIIEDVDCSLDLSDRKKKEPRPENELEQPETPQTPKESSGVSMVSLSGVLNFVDGLWSSCVGERLMIFTTNHPERLDQALLRPGRMDRIIHLSYCSPEAFRVLARNYLEVGPENEHMVEAEALLREIEMTPAEIAEVFMGCDGQEEGADVAMLKVVKEMRRRKEALLEATVAPPAAERETLGGETRKIAKIRENGFV